MQPTSIVDNFVSVTPLCLENFDGPTKSQQQKPRVRKLSSPNKRSLTRQRNKAKMSSHANPELQDVPPLKAHQYLLRKEKCLSDNDGDDEGESLLAASSSAAASAGHHDGSSRVTLGSSGINAFSSMPRQGRRKKSKKVEEFHTKEASNREPEQKEPLLESNPAVRMVSFSALNGCQRQKSQDSSGVGGGDENDALPQERSKK
jgi:hypothetical protein